LISDEMKYRLWILLNQASCALTRQRDIELKKYGFSVEESGILHVIQIAGGNATPAKIARYIIRKPNSVSRIVSRMEKKGLVRKSNDSKLKNQVRITLTDKGYQAYKNSTKKRSIIKVMSCLPEETQQRLFTDLMKLRDKALKDIGINNGVPYPQKSETANVARKAKRKKTTT
jgi:DNA-binding MarR family transcriptional regulator